MLSRHHDTRLIASSNLLGVGVALGVCSRTLSAGLFWAGFALVLLPVLLWDLLLWDTRQRRHLGRERER